jgi:glycerol kinase
MAEKADPTEQVYLVPAFVGLGAPHWDAKARGAIYGITRGTGPNELARATLESVCYQTLDLLEAMESDITGSTDAPLRVDGGMVASDWTLQRLADILDRPVHRPKVLETTALGAAWLAGMHSGVWPEEQGFASAWVLDARFDPGMPTDTRRQLIAGWRDAVRRTLS